MQTYKPGSVSPPKRSSYHLSSPAIAGEIDQPTHSVTPINRDHGRATHCFTTNETYLVFQHARFTMPLMSPSER